MNVNLSKLWKIWRTKEPGMLQSMELQKSDMTSHLNNNSHN